VTRSAPLPAPPPRPRVLVLEDEVIVAMELELRLGEDGFEVVGRAADAARALELAARGPRDVVLADVKLRGGADGIEVAGRVRELTGASVIVISAFADEATRARSRLVGAIRHLAKPVADGALREALEAALAARGGG
jgi:CheY-like chemotaxis protein